MTLRHTTECSLVQEAQNLPPYCPLKVTGTQAATRIIIPKSSNFFCECVLGWNYHAFPPTPPPTLQDSLPLIHTAYGAMKVILFCEFGANHMRSIHFAALVAFTVRNRRYLQQHFTIYCAVPMASCSGVLNSETVNLLDVWLDSLFGLRSDLKASICIKEKNTEQARTYTNHLTPNGHFSGRTTPLT